LQRAHALIRSRVAFWSVDRAFAPDLEAIRREVETGAFVPMVGPLLDPAVDAA